MAGPLIFRDYTPSEPAPEPDSGKFLVVYRESDRLLASAFDTDVPILAWGQLA